MAPGRARGGKLEQLDANNRLAAWCPRCGRRVRIFCTPSKIEAYREKPPDDVVETVACTSRVAGRACPGRVVITAGAYVHATFDPLDATWQDPRSNQNSHRTRVWRADDGDDRKARD